MTTLQPALIAPFPMTPKRLREIENDCRAVAEDARALCKGVRWQRAWLNWLLRTAGKRELGLADACKAALKGAPAP